MDLKEILDNYRSMKSSLKGMGSWHFPLEQILHKLFGRYVPEDEDHGYASYIGVERIEVYTMLKLFHEDTRTTEVHVVVIDDRPIAVVYAVGAGWRSQITDAEKYKTVCHEMAESRLNQELSAASTKLERLADLGASAIALLGPRESMFAIPVPKLIDNFDELADERKAYFVDDSTSPQLVERILFGKVDTGTSGRLTNENAVQVLIAGSVHVVDGSRIMFEVIPGRGDVEDALSAFRK